MKNLIFTVVFFAGCFSLYNFQQCAFEANIDYNGNDINPTAPVYLSTLDLCCQLCQNTAECQAWTYVPLTQACWLKRNIGNLRIISAGRNSGVKIQTGVLPAPAPVTTLAPSQTVTAAPGVTRAYGCFVETNVNYPGNDITVTTNVQSNVPSAVECCNLCGATTGCLSFVYSIDFRYCWFKSRAHEATNRQAYPNFVSGIVTLR